MSKKKKLLMIFGLATNHFKPSSLSISFFTFVAQNGSTIPHFLTALIASTMLPFASWALAKTRHAFFSDGAIWLAKVASSIAPATYAGIMSNRASARRISACAWANEFLNAGSPFDKSDIIELKIASFFVMDIAVTIVR